jgi:hypothetical protein
MDHDCISMVDVYLQVNEFLCLFKEVHMSIHMKYFAYLVKDIPIRLLTMLVSLISLELWYAWNWLCNFTSWGILINMVCWATSFP